MEPKWSQNPLQKGSETVSDSDLFFYTFLFKFVLIFKVFRDDVSIPIEIIVSSECKMPMFILSDFFRWILKVLL